MPGILCEHCTGVCCKYIALPIDKPTTRAELDDVRWYLLHEGVSVFVEEGEWYISFQTTCRHLQPDNRCGIYETRPRICRKYSTENCDYHSGDYGWEHHFSAPEHLDEYRRLHLGKSAVKPARGKRSKAPRRQVSRIRARLPAQLLKKAGSPSATADLRGVPLPILSITGAAIGSAEGNNGQSTGKPSQSKRRLN